MYPEQLFRMELGERRECRDSVVVSNGFGDLLCMHLYAFCVDLSGFGPRLVCASVCLRRKPPGPRLSEGTRVGRAKGQRTAETCQHRVH